MASTQTKYIGATTFILSISLLLSWFVSRPDFKNNFSPNITCMGDCINPSDSDCIGYFNITSLSKRFYTRNKGDLNIPFTEPEKVKSFQVYRADLRFRTDNLNRFKPINISKGFTLQVNQTNEFRINLCKNNPEDDIKWGIDGFGIEEDSIFFGIEKAERFDNCCFRIKGKIINYSKYNFKCNQNGSILECDSCYDGNCNGVCTSGESCIKIDIKDFSIKSRLDTKSMKVIEIEEN